MRLEDLPARARQQAEALLQQDSARVARRRSQSELTDGGPTPYECATPGCDWRMPDYSDKSQALHATATGHIRFSCVVGGYASPIPRSEEPSDAG